MRGRFDWKYILKALVDFVLPRFCVVCKRTLLVNEKGLCLHCLEDLPYTYNWKLRQNSMAQKFNLLSKDMELPYVYACSLFYYEQNSDYKHITPALKYHNNIEVGKLISKLLAEKIKEVSHLKDIDLIIPVPLHWRRKWNRGYNQSEIIAQALSGELKVNFRTDLLRRSKNTKSQTKLSIEEKKNNVSTAFRLTDKGIADIPKYRHILLVDDVFTTGATLLACYIEIAPYIQKESRLSIATLSFVIS